MHATPPFRKDDFSIPEGVVHVCAGGEAPLLRRHEAVLRRFARDKGEGEAGRRALHAEVGRARALAARMLGVDIGDVGFSGSVADGVAMVVDSLSWRPGDNVCVHADEYPSVVAPFAFSNRGIEMRFGGPGRLADIVDERTRVIAVSHVSYLNGERIELEPLRALADSVGAMLIVDFTQAAGYMPVDAGIADFSFSACYKWLLGTTGAALACWNRRRQPGWWPATAGWHSLDPALPWPDVVESIRHARADPAASLRADALRIVRGNPAHLPIYVLADALDYLTEADMQAVQRHVHALTTALLERLAAAGIPSTTPRDPARHGASVCIESAHARVIVERLRARGVYAWNGRGRVRFSFHGYNDIADVERIGDALVREWKDVA